MRSLFPSSDDAAWLLVEDEDNIPEFLRGEYCLLDPAVSPSPGRMVIARLPNHGVNVFRQYTITGLGAKGEPVITLRPLSVDAILFEWQRTHHGARDTDRACHRHDEAVKLSAFVLSATLRSGLPDSRGRYGILSLTPARAGKQKGSKRIQPLVPSEVRLAV